MTLLTGLMIASVLIACATPRHTNTLIFATSTRVALDVSQDPTGAVGVTLGYKRYEGVWMPLLANQAASGTEALVPAECTGDKCRFVGTTGDKGGAAGPEAEDTYSVLATFSGRAAGGAGGTAPTAEANAALAQYFATGLAARMLAEKGGAALVNTKAVPPEIQQQATAILVDREEKKRQIVAHLKKDDGSIDQEKLDALLAREPASKIDPEQKRRLKEAGNVVALRERLDRAAFESLAEPLYKSLP
jgi:hypothetical protein